MKSIYSAIASTVILLSSACGGAGWQPQTAPQPVAVAPTPEAEETVDRFLETDPGLASFFNSAYGFAVFPTIGKGGMGLGGGYGSGEVYEQNVLVGKTTMTQLTVGFQLGGQSYSEIIFFRDKSTLDRFRTGNFELGAQASAVALTSGASTDASYDGGVAIFTATKAGLMYEATVAGQKFDYEPL